MKKTLGWFFILLPFMAGVCFMVYISIIKFGWLSVLIPLGVLFGIGISFFLGWWLLVWSEL